MVAVALEEKVARAIDPEAWIAIEDGRDELPDSLWHIRRHIAKDKARAAIAAVLAELMRMPDAARQHCRKHAFHRSGTSLKEPEQGADKHGVDETQRQELGRQCLENRAHNAGEGAISFGHESRLCPA